MASFDSNFTFVEGDLRRSKSSEALRNNFPPSAPPFIEENRRLKNRLKKLLQERNLLKQKLAARLQILIDSNARKQRTVRQEEVQQATRKFVISSISGEA